MPEFGDKIVLFTSEQSVSRLLRREHLRRDLFIYLDSQQK